MKKTMLVIGCLMLIQRVSWGETYYVDPMNGNINNDGSSGSPWSTLQEIFEMGKIGNPVQPGDTILLRSGYHGQIDCSNARNSDYITIAAQPGHTPTFKRIELTSCSKWILKGLTISPEFASVFEKFGHGLIRIHNSQDIIIENNNIFSVQDASSWTANDWNSLASRGINMTSSPNLIIRNNTIKNVQYGITSDFGHGTLIEYNKVEHNIGDGIQVYSTSNIIIQYNTLKNFYDVSRTHMDGIQFYHPPNDNVILRGNIIIHQDPDVDKFPGNMHGIGCFDPPYNNWLVENNVVIIPHMHGIAIYGATDSTIINNIAFHPTPTYSTGVEIHTGDRGSNTVIRNNMANVVDTDGTNMTGDHNIDIDDYGPDMLFVDYLNNDLRHKPGSPAIDAGNPDLAPLIDLLGNLRDALPDVGCYEYGALPPEGKYTLSVNASGSGTMVKTPNKYLFDENDIVSIQAYPNGGFVFESWSGDAAGSQNPTTVTMDSNKSITAQFIEITTNTNTYNLTVEVVGNGTITKNPDKTSYNDGESVVIQANPALGYKFISWMGDVEGEENPATIIMDADKSIIAQFNLEFNPLAEEITEKKLHVYNNILKSGQANNLTIWIDVKETSRVSVILYDNKGKKIKTLINEEKEQGRYPVVWDGSDESGKIVGSGIYMVFMNIGNYKETKKIAVIK